MIISSFIRQAYVHRRNWFLHQSISQKIKLKRKISLKTHRFQRWYPISLLLLQSVAPCQSLRICVSETFTQGDFKNGFQSNHCGWRFLTKSNDPSSTCWWQGGLKLRCIRKQTILYTKGWFCEKTAWVLQGQGGFWVELAWGPMKESRCLSIFKIFLASQSSSVTFVS